MHLEEAHRLEKINPGPTAFKQIYEVIGKNNSFCNKIIHNDVTTTDADKMC
mgnify:CR=1 FL=1